MASETVTDPAAFPSRVVTFISMSRALVLGFSRRIGLRFGRGWSFTRGAELAGLRRLLGKRALGRIAHPDPAALGARNGAFDEDQAALDIGLHDLEVERGDTVDTHVAGHLLVLEGLAGILTATGRTD